MDELTIDEKKYISSKRAAQITGYAKDYIGQLCREGRVPARLVGRNWYVLESAISDHRFGPPEPIPASAPAPAPAAGAPAVGAREESRPGHTASRQGSVVELPQTWEAPRYASIDPEPLPQLNRMEQMEAEAEPAAAEELAEPFMDSWRNWFDHIAEIAPETKHQGASPQGPNEAEATRIQEPKPQEGLPAPEEQMPEEEINIPIHTVYDLPPRELLPNAHERPTRSFMGEDAAEVAAHEEEVQVYEERVRKPRIGALRRTYAVIRAVGAIIAIGAIGIATVASGYFDTYISSYSQASAITGISVYEK